MLGCPYVSPALREFPHDHPRALSLALVLSFRNCWDNTASKKFLEANAWMKVWENIFWGSVLRGGVIERDSSIVNRTNPLPMYKTMKLLHLIRNTSTIGIHRITHLATYSDFG